MGRKCSVYGCRGNYKGEPYSPIVSASKTKYPEDRLRWIAAMPNERSELEEREEIRVCKSHFDCEWYSVQGGGV